MLRRAGVNFDKHQIGGVFVRFLVFVGVPLAAGLATLSWYVANERYVTTDNAYVKADIIAISPSMDGRVTSVSVRDNQPVGAGDVLFELDSRPHQMTLQRANARIALIRNEIESMRAHYAQIDAEIADAVERVRYLERQREREKELGSRGMTTDAKIETADYQVIEATQRVRALRERAHQALAELSGDITLPPETHPKYLEALAELNEAELNLEYTIVRAPADGKVSRMKLQPGEWVEAGDPVFSLVEDGELWIEANLKETQLTHVKVRQTVEVEVDTYPGVEWRGEVASISSATGSEFLLLPAQNATGNWVKVVQRVPVRIDIDEHYAQHPLRAGMTVTVAVDTERERKMLTVVREAVASMRGE